MKTSLLIIIIITCIGVIFAMCWHSPGEIHYLKTFFPRKFTVTEAFYVSAAEMIMIISLPFILAIAASLYLLRIMKNKN